MMTEPAGGMLVRRLETEPAGRVLELAAGTGAMTRQLIERPPPGFESLVATDISQPMIDVGQAIVSSGSLRWEAADAHDLAFPDQSFDTVICHFGAMYFSDKEKAFAEAHRVLKDGGRLIMSLWTRKDENEFAAAVDEALRELFPGRSPNYLSCLAYGYHDAGMVETHLQRAGFTNRPLIETLHGVSVCSDALSGAYGYVCGTPIRYEVAALGVALLPRAVSRVETALAVGFGLGNIAGNTKVHMVTARRNR